MKKADRDERPGRLTRSSAQTSVGFFFAFFVFVFAFFVFGRFFTFGCFVPFLGFLLGFRFFSFFLGLFRRGLLFSSRRLFRRLGRRVITTG